MIIANNVNKQFGKLKALNNVSVNCSKGECIALIGPNGCGKTTLIKSIFIKFKNPKILIFGFFITTLSLFSINGIFVKVKQTL